MDSINCGGFETSWMQGGGPVERQNKGSVNFFRETEFPVSPRTENFHWVKGAWLICHAPGMVFEVVVGTLYRSACCQICMTVKFMLHCWLPCEQVIREHMKNKIICQRKWLSTGHLDTRLAKSLFPCKFIVSFLQIKFPKYNVFPRLIKNNSFIACRSQMVPISPLFSPFLLWTIIVWQHTPTHTWHCMVVVWYFKPFRFNLRR